MNKVKGNWLFIYPIARKRPDSQGQGGRTKIGRLGTAPRAAVWAGAVLALLLAASPPAFAQTCPTTTTNPITCPATITSCGCVITTATNSGSYTLKNNLWIPKAWPAWASGNCIDVKTGDVSIDLNGFMIGGALTGKPYGYCGINGQGQNNVSVRNGTVALFATANVALGNRGIVENVRSYGYGNGSGGIGIDCGASCLIKGNVVYGNGGLGLSLSSPTSGYVDNVLNDNSGVTTPGPGGQVSGGTSLGLSGTELGYNLCNGSPC